MTESQQPLLPSQLFSAPPPSVPPPSIGGHAVQSPISETSCLNPVVSVVKSLAGGIILLAMIVALPSAITAHHFDSSISLTYTWIAIPITLVGGRLAYLWYKRSKEPVVIEDVPELGISYDVQPERTAGPFGVVGMTSPDELYKRTQREVSGARFHYCREGKPIVGDPAVIQQRMRDQEAVKAALTHAVGPAGRLDDVFRELQTREAQITAIINECQRVENHAPYPYVEELNRLNISDNELREQVVAVMLELIGQAHREAFNTVFAPPADADETQQQKLYSLELIQNQELDGVVLPRLGLTAPRPQRVPNYRFFNYNPSKNQVEWKMIYQYRDGNDTKYIPVRALYTAAPRYIVDEGRSCRAVRYPACDDLEEAVKILNQDWQP